MLQAGRTRDRFQTVTLVIYSVAADISVCSGVDSASKNEYQDVPGGKGGRCVRVTTLPPSCAECLVIWSLNRPEPSGPHRGCFTFYLLQYGLGISKYHTLYKLARVVDIKTTATTGQVFLHACSFVTLSSGSHCWSRSNNTNYMSRGKKQRINTRH